MANVSVYSSGNCLYVFVFLFLSKFFNVQTTCALFTYDRETLLEIGKRPHGFNLDLPDLDCLLRYNSL